MNSDGKQYVLLGIVLYYQSEIEKKNDFNCRFKM